MIRRKTTPLQRRTTNQSWSTVEFMGTIPQSPSVMPPKVRPQSRDTGFPEPFCAFRNTCLPHPEANLSPDATICAEDVSLARAELRQRRSLFEKHKRATSYGKITPEMELMYSDNRTSLTADSDLLQPSRVSSSIDLAASRPQTSYSSHRHQQSDVRLSKDGAESLTGTDGTAGSSGEESPVGPKKVFAASVDEDRHRRRNPLQLWRHK